MAIRPLATATAIMLLGACASTPQTPAASHPVASAAAANQPVARAPAPTSTPTAKVTTDDHASTLSRRAGELGYRVEKQKGQRVYCLTSAQIGTRFQTKGCLTEADFESVVRRSEELKTIMIQQQGGCTGAGCVTH